MTPTTANRTANGGIPAGEWRITVTLPSLEVATAALPLLQDALRTADLPTPGARAADVPFKLAQVNLRKLLLERNAADLLRTVKHALAWCRDDARNEDGFPTQEMLDNRVSILRAAIRKATPPKNKPTTST